MDPITQGALGATAGQILPKHKDAHRYIAPASLMAAIAGMSPDLDVLIRSDIDPLLFLVYHRQFTHSLFFIPFGALICAAILHFLIGKRYQFRFSQSYLFCFAGYATHALLDACTTYGTLLLWPFSDHRFAWHSIAVVDLFYTVPILIALWLGIKKQSAWPARIICIWVLAYPVLGLIQKNKAEQAAFHYLEEHLNIKPVHLNAKPSMGNLLLWKLVYEHENYFHVDAVRVGIFESVKHARYYSGDKVKKLNIKEDFPWLEQNTQQANDVQRFSWFSMDYVAKDVTGELTGKKNSVIDVRYSIVPNEINPLWSIELNPEAEIWEHVKYHNHRDRAEAAREKFLKMLLGEAL
jgi:inner membrane protein